MDGATDFESQPMIKPRQRKYKPPVHKPQDHVYVSAEEKLAALEKAKVEREEHERRWGWLGEVFAWLIYLAFFGFLVTSCVQGDFKFSESQECSFYYRGSCDG